MRLEGLHHVTMITADAPGTVAFHGDVLGLRLVKKTVNFDQPTAYHLYFGDERGSPGSILTWFEFPDAAPGSAGAGMIHTIRLGVGGEEALDFWERRLGAAGVAAERAAGALRFADPEGLRFELAVAGEAGPPLRARHPEIAPEHAITGVTGARAYAGGRDDGTLLTGVLGFEQAGPREYRLDGERRGFDWGYDEPPAQRGRQGAGSVHHIAWASRDEDHLGWQRAVADAGVPVTDVRDRDYFRSIYFPDARGVLFEIATLSPGFAVDEDPAHLGEELRLPAMHAHLRDRLERTLTPLVNPRAARREAF
jgi:glyoxalase family protein